MDDGRFTTEGPREFMVTKMSTEYGQNVRNIMHLPSDADHGRLVRFEDSKDANYMSMRNTLKAIAAQALQELQSETRSGYFGGAMLASKYRPTVFDTVPSVLSVHKIMQRTTMVLLKLEPVETNTPTRSETQASKLLALLAKL